jgi:hypothetical protein
LHRGGGADGANGVVLSDLRYAEDGHQSIAGVLHDSAVERVNTVTKKSEESVHLSASRLRIHPFLEGGGADEIGEEDGYGFA